MKAAAPIKADRADLASQLKLHLCFSVTEDAGGFMKVPLPLCHNMVSNGWTSRVLAVTKIVAEMQGHKSDKNIIMLSIHEVTWMHKPQDLLKVKI